MLRELSKVRTPVLKDEVIIIGAHLDAVGNAGGIIGARRI